MFTHFAGEVRVNRICANIKLVSHRDILKQIVVQNLVKSGLHERKVYGIFWFMVFFSPMHNQVFKAFSTG